jgi:hypothetical protein
MVLGVNTLFGAFSDAAGVGDWIGGGERVGFGNAGGFGNDGIAEMVCAGISEADYVDLLTYTMSELGIQKERITYGGSLCSDVHRPASLLRGCQRCTPSS